MFFHFNTSVFSSIDTEIDKQTQDDLGLLGQMKKSVLDSIRAHNQISLDLQSIMDFSLSRLQRWVGVQYRSESEMQSHYGKLNLGKCYDQIIFIDKSTALKPVSDSYINLAARIKAREVMTPTTQSSEHVSTAATNKRLLKEYRRIRQSCFEIVLKQRHRR